MLHVQDGSFIIIFTSPLCR